MATSRTGTTKWIALRKRVIHNARSAGITNCPNCQKPLDYTTPRQPNSAEADHIIPHSQGGLDVIDNVRVWCRDCNVKRQSRERWAAKTTVPERAVASRAW